MESMIIGFIVLVLATPPALVMIFILCKDGCVYNSVRRSEKEEIDLNKVIGLV